MHRLTGRFIPFAVLLLLASGCGGGEDTPTTPEPTPDKTESFQGVLTLNGAFSHPFTVTAASNITGQLISLSPDATLTVGLALGTWNGSICQEVLANDATKQGDVVAGATQTPGDFCVRIYDAKGIVVEPQAYAVLVFHQ